MIEPAARASGGIFISYRRKETAAWAGRLRDKLAERFGSARVFMDVDSIGPGADFPAALARELGTCHVLLPVIGREWLAMTNERGRRCLDDPNDYVRQEIAAALERDILVIPILVDGASMPSAQDLPDSLSKLAYRQAVSLRHDNFKQDIDRLIREIKKSWPSARSKPQQRWEEQHEGLALPWERIAARAIDLFAVAVLAIATWALAGWLGMPQRSAIVLVSCPVEALHNYDAP